MPGRPTGFPRDNRCVAVRRLSGQAGAPVAGKVRTIQVVGWRRVLVLGLLWLGLFGLPWGAVAAGPAAGEPPPLLVLGVADAQADLLAQG